MTNGCEGQQKLVHARFYGSRWRAQVDHADFLDFTAVNFPSHHDHSPFVLGLCLDERYLPCPDPEPQLPVCADESILPTLQECWRAMKLSEMDVLEKTMLYAQLDFQRCVLRRIHQLYHTHMLFTSADSDQEPRKVGEGNCSLVC